MVVGSASGVDLANLSMRVGRLGVISATSPNIVSLLVRQLGVTSVVAPRSRAAVVVFLWMAEVGMSSADTPPEIGLASVARLPLLLLDSSIASRAAVCCRRVARCLAMSPMLRIFSVSRGIDSTPSVDALGIANERSSWDLVVAAHAGLLLKTGIGGPVTAMTWLLVSTAGVLLLVNPSCTTTSMATVHVCSVAA